MGRTYTLQAIDPISGRLLGDPIVRPGGPRARPAPEPGPVAEPEPYPERGTVEDVLAWVGYDPDRAKAATVAEHGRDKPRKTLLAELSERTA